MANIYGLHSPPSRSDAASPRPKFDSDLLKAYMKKLLSSTLQNSSWPEQKDNDRVQTWIKEIGRRVKERMIEIQPQGFKYIVLTQIYENLGQAAKADMVSHWEKHDIAVQEVYSNTTLLCICIALAIS
ncbi:hypothetical protein H2248_006133 [Termitomyces sp. 'cryptogamus']|nr:hypothetical protein H2248_006133 [Termitomyces sp. 'cryptogamus']